MNPPSHLKTPGPIPVEPTGPAGQKKHSSQRRLAALIIPVFVLMAELVCRILGWGQSPEGPWHDSAFQKVQTLFELNPSNDRYQIRPDREKFFVQESFSAHKQDAVFRIFCVGGSTVQGRPFGKETAFSTWLKLSLEEAQPERRWEVINCGGVSYGTQRLMPVWEECLTYEPDLMILCVGHNEFLEGQSEDFALNQPLANRWANFILEQSYSVRFIRNGLRRLSTRDPRASPGTEDSHAGWDVDAFLDYKDGLKAYHRDPVWHQNVFKRFESNLRRMFSMAQEAGVPLLVLTPPSNLRDSPPFKSEHRPGLSEEELQRWQDLIRSASFSFQTNLSQTVRLLNQARHLDVEYAETDYLLGKALLGLAQPGPAKKAFLRARDLDVCPLRILSSMEVILNRATADGKVRHLNVHRHLETQSVWNILGNDWMADHVHPSLRGHQEMARSIMQLMIEEKWVQPEVDWESRRDIAYGKHLATLDMIYFVRGQQRLDNLRAWTQGRADGPPIEQKIRH